MLVIPLVSKVAEKLLHKFHYGFDAKMISSVG